MIDLNKILEHLDNQIKLFNDASRCAKTEKHMMFCVNKIEFLQNLRIALTIKEQDISK